MVTGWKQAVSEDQAVVVAAATRRRRELNGSAEPGSAPGEFPEVVRWRFPRYSLEDALHDSTVVSSLQEIGMPRISPLQSRLVATLIVLGLARVPAAAPQDKTARGRATAVTNVSLTVKVGDRDMTFDVDSKTVVRTEGAGRHMSGDQTIGPNGKLTSLVQAGDAVVVTYREVKGRNRAIEIARTPRIPPAR
jgi:hypothetical protein